MTFWGWEEDLGTEVKVWIRLAAEGKELRISACAGRADSSKCQWSRVIRICNEWNSERRWPKAYLGATLPVFRFANAKLGALSVPVRATRNWPEKCDALCD